MHNLLLIARREYLEQIRGRAFRITTILVPTLFVALIGVMVLAGRGANGAKHIVIASNDASLADAVRDVRCTTVDFGAAADVGVAPFDVGAHSPLALGFYWSPLKIFEYMAAGRAIVAAAGGEEAGHGERQRQPERAEIVGPFAAHANTSWKSPRKIAGIQNRRDRTALMLRQAQHEGLHPCAYC